MMMQHNHTCIDFRIYTKFINGTRWSIVFEMNAMNELYGCVFYDRHNVARAAFIHTCGTKIKKKTTPALNEPFRLEKEAIVNQGWASHSACMRYLTHSAAVLVKRIKHFTSAFGCFF